jgi:hypothetical protein
MEKALPSEGRDCVGSNPTTSTQRSNRVLRYRIKEALLCLSDEMAAMPALEAGARRSVQVRLLSETHVKVHR